MIELQRPSPSLLAAYLEFIEEMLETGEKIWESMIQKSCARVSERHATRMSDKQRDAHLMFQIADASADSRFPNAKFNGCLPKAMFLCGSQYIAQIPTSGG